MTTLSTPSLRIVGVAALALSLGACARQNHITTGSIIPEDVRARHPIVLAQTPQTLDIFVAGDKTLDKRSLGDIEQFAREYRANGTGAIRILTPNGGLQTGRAAAAVPAIRRALAAHGVRGGVEVGVYPVADPRLAAPVRLVYAGLTARTATRCGEWPDDLGAAGSKGGWDNRPYYNLGCSYQQNLAAQIADPRDLVTPRKMDPADGQMRLRGITAVRGGTDPTTTYTYTPNWMGPVSP